MKGGEINSTNLLVKFCKLINTFYLTFNPMTIQKMYLLVFPNRCLGILSNIIEETSFGSCFFRTWSLIVQILKVSSYYLGIVLI